MKGRVALLILTLLLFLIPQSVGPKNLVSDVVTKDTAPATSSIKAAQTITVYYLGYRVRFESWVIVNGTLLYPETGDPISDAPVYLYLDKAGDDIKQWNQTQSFNPENDDDDILLASNYTDKNGTFIFNVTIVEYFDIGHNILAVYFPGDDQTGPSMKFYNVTVYARVYVGIELSSYKLALFEKNVTASFWLQYDNGTRITGSYNISVLLWNGALKSFIAQTDPDTGSNTTIIEFNETGDHYVEALFNVSEHRESLGLYVLGLNETLNETTGEISGNGMSYATAIFTVYEATKFVLGFSPDYKQKSCDVYRNGSNVTIYGFYFDVRGNPANGTVRLYIGSKTYDVVAQNGEFSFTIEVNTSSFEVGNYEIKAADLNDTTEDLSDILTLTVRSKLKLIIDSVQTPLEGFAPAGASIQISGRLLEEWTNSSINSGTVTAYVPQPDGSKKPFQMSTTLGEFRLLVRIPDTVPDPTITIDIVGEYSQFYDPANASLTFNTLNFVYLNFTFNDTLFSWQVHYKTIMGTVTNPQIEVEENSTISILFRSLDDFGRPHPVTVQIAIGNKTLYETRGDFFTFSFRVNATSFTLTLKVRVDAFGEEYAFDVLVYVKKKPRITPISLLVPAAIVAVIVGSIAVAMFSGRRVQEVAAPKAVGELSSRLLLNEIKRELMHEDLESAIKKAGVLIMRIAQELRGSYPPWMTLRELVKFIVEEFKPPVSETVKHALMSIVLIFEKVIYGAKEPTDEDIKNFAEALKVIERFVIPKILGAEGGEAASVE